MSAPCENREWPPYACGVDGPSFDMLSIFGARSMSPDSGCEMMIFGWNWLAWFENFFEMRGSAALPVHEGWEAELNLIHRGLGPVEGAILCACLLTAEAAASLKKLILSFNDGLGDEGVAAIVDGLAAGGGWRGAGGAGPRQNQLRLAAAAAGGRRSGQPEEAVSREQRWPAALLLPLPAPAAAPVSALSLSCCCAYPPALRCPCACCPAVLPPAAPAVPCCLGRGGAGGDQRGEPRVRQVGILARSEVKQAPTLPSFTA